MGAFTTTALLITGAVAAGVSAYGQVRAGDASRRAGEREQEAANSQADLQDYNAEIADLQAADAIARGVEEEQRYRTSVRGIIGSQRAAFAGGNIDVGFGSALDVQEDAAYLGELDALQIRTNAAREAWGYKVQAEDLRRRGTITRREGRNLREAGREGQTQQRIGALGTVLGAGNSLLQQRYGFGRG